MKNLILCTVAVLILTITLLGGYYRYSNGASQETTATSIQQTEDKNESAYPTNPDWARKWLADAWRDENGHVWAEGLGNAVAQRDAYIAGHAPQGGVGDNGFAKMNWLPRGPQNVGGRTRSLVIDPTDSTGNTMWAGAVSGGVWKSTNGGDSWTAMNGGLQNFAVNCMALDVGGSGRKTLWAGTGEGFSGPGLAGGGLFKSTNGGMSWAIVPQSDRDHGNWKYIDSIAVTHKPTGETVILAGVEQAQDSLFHDKGIMRSEDGGAHWSQVRWSQVVDDATATSVAFDPVNPANAIAAVVEDVAVGPGRALWSDNFGETWNLASRNGSAFQTAQAIYLSYKAFNPKIVIAEDGHEDGSNNPPPSTLSVSPNGGHDYSTKDGILEFGAYKHLLWISPLQNEDVIVTGGRFLSRSIDSGDHFEKIANSFTSYDAEPHMTCNTQLRIPDTGHPVEIR